MGLTPPLAAGLLAYVHVFQVSRDRVVASATALLWFAGLGVLDRFRDQGVHQRARSLRT